MFKKFLKNLTGDAEKAAQDATQSQPHAGSYTDVLKAYMKGGEQEAFDVGAASVGYTTMNTATEDPNDPQLQPVHGITIYDYAAGAAKLGAGCTEEQVCQVLGVERPLWDEAQTTWNNRMRDDSTFNVMNVYSKYFGMAKDHEKLGVLQPANAPATDVPSDAASETLQRLENDKHYFFEIQGAMQAAYDNGIDGAQWLIDNLGLTVAQVNSAGTKWMSNMNIMAEMIDHQEKMKNEYSQRFAQESGSGGVADDINF